MKKVVAPGILSVRDSMTRFFTPERKSNRKNYRGTKSWCGFSIGVFAKDIANARDFQFSPQGTLLFSKTSVGTITVLPDKNKAA